MSEPIVLRLKCKGGTQTWCAVVKGRSRKFGLDREFVASIEGKKHNLAKKKKGFVAEYMLDEDATLIEVCELSERYFLKIVNGAPVPIDKDEAYSIIKAMEDRKRQVAKDVEKAVARFNSEGGFNMEPSTN